MGKPCNSIPGPRADLVSPTGVSGSGAPFWTEVTQRPVSSARSEEPCSSVPTQESHVFSHSGAGLVISEAWRGSLGPSRPLRPLP